MSTEKLPVNNNIRKIKSSEKEWLPAFNLEQKVNLETWEKLKQELEHHRTSADWLRFSWLASRMVIISPERVSDLKLNDKAWQGIKAVINSDLKEKKWFDLSWRLVELKNLFPERIKELNLDDNEVVIGINEVSNQYRARADWEAWSWHTANLKLIFPEQANSSLEKEAISSIEKKLEDFKKIGDWWNFVMLAMYFKIISHKTIKELGIDQETWKKIEQKLDELRESGNMENFSQFALEMKTLAS